MNLFKQYLNDYNKTLKVTVSYDKGGMNYFTYKTDKRGYYLSVSPVEITKGEGYQTESYVMFSGIKTLLLEVNRASKSAEAKALGLKDGQLQELIDHVVKKNNLIKNDTVNG